MHSLVGRVGGAEQQVLADGAGEHRGVLLDVADLAAQLLAVEAADVDAAEAHDAGGRVVEPLDEGEDGALAGAGRADERRALAALRPRTRRRAARCGRAASTRARPTASSSVGSTARRPGS